MRVLWFSPTPSMYDEGKAGGWVASLEQAFRAYQPDVDLAIAFDYAGGETVTRDNVTYYPMSYGRSIADRINLKLGKTAIDSRYLPCVLSVIEDFKPDVIQCFGSEWPYGLVAEHSDTPVVIHMQGFLNIYSLESSLAFSKNDLLRAEGLTPKTLYHALFDARRSEAVNAREREIMAVNRYFMGRTNWDRQIVRYFSPSAQYFHCEEALRPAIYDAKTAWSWKGTDVPTLITITQAGTLKGNEMILRTAKLLKEQFHFDFAWRVAGDKRSFARFEKKTGIRHEDVGIELLGMIPAEQIVQELSSARLYVHPAIIDNSPNSLCEAQLIGCPVLASYVGGIPSLVDDGKTGFLYPYEEPYSLAFMIMRVASDRTLLEAVSNMERSVATARHDPEVLASQIVSIYRNIIVSNETHSS